MLETGTNNDRKTCTGHSAFTTIADNKIEEKEGIKYNRQNTGAGTAIIKRKGILSQQITDRLNNDKMGMAMVITKLENGESFKLITGGIQARNRDSETKAGELKEIL